MKRIIWIGLVVWTLTVVTACVAPLTNNEKEALTVAMIPKIIDIAYFDRCADGARDVAAKYGMNLIYTGPTTADAASQVNILQDMIYKKVDVIAIAPVDPEAVKPVLKKAMEAGIIVVTYDADSAEGSRDVFVSQVSAEVLGRHIMDNVATMIGENGTYAIITASMTADNQNTWINYIKDQNEALYPGIELLTIIPTDEDQKKAYANTRNLIHAYPELDALIAMSTEAGPAAASAIESMGAQDQVGLYCLSLPKAMKTYVLNGSADVVTLWDPYKLGALTMETIQALYNGEGLEALHNLEGFEEVTYDKQEGVVVMGSPLDFDKTNIEGYDF